MADVSDLRVPRGTNGRGEIGYAERTTNATTTNTLIASAPSNKISGLAVTVVGTGRAVEIEYFCPGAYSTSAANYAGAVILQDGVIVGLGVTRSSTASVGMVLVSKARRVLTAGQSYTFEVGIYGQAGTLTYVCDPTYPQYLAVTER